MKNRIKMQLIYLTYEPFKNKEASVPDASSVMVIEIFTAYPGVQHFRDKH